MTAPLGTAPVSLTPDEVVEAYVVVQNKNIGHSLIPEVRDLYEAWMRFSVKDASGEMIYESRFPGRMERWNQAPIALPIGLST